MLVRSQRWRQWAPILGKYHWMVKPWLTACGMKVTDEWDLIPLGADRGDVEENGCKRCWIGGDDG